MRGMTRRTGGPTDLTTRLRKLLLPLIFLAKTGSVWARSVLTLGLFLLIWGLLSIPDAFGASVTRASSFTYDSASGLILTETVEPNDSAFTLTTTCTYDGYGNKLTATTSGAGIASRTTSTTRR